MIRYECIFKKGNAGYLEVNNFVDSEEQKYRFMPYRSKAHLRLAELVKDNKKPVVILKSQQQTVEAEILNMSIDSITVRMRKNKKKDSFLDKIFSLFNN